MALIGAEFYVEVGGIVVDRDILGQSIKVLRGDARFRIDFPDGPNAFSYFAASSLTAGGTADPREYTPTAAVVGESESFAEVRVVRVVVNTPSGLTSEGFASSDPGQRQLHDDLLSELPARVVDLVEELCARLNLDADQRWMEPRGKYPRVVNMAGLIDIDARTTFGVLLGSAGHILVLPSVVDTEALARAADRLNAGPAAPDEMLLVEARYLANADFPTAPERSVLLAAIAVELRTKRLLGALARASEQAAALDLLLNNPRDWSMSVHGLFLKALPTFAGVERGGLGKEHIELAKRVQRLFVSRNLIAHTGVALTRADAEMHVQTASDAFAFMESLEVPAAGGQSEPVQGASDDEAGQGDEGDEGAAAGGALDLK